MILMLALLVLGLFVVGCSRDVVIDGNVYRQPRTAHEQKLISEGHGITISLMCGHIVGRCRCLQCDGEFLINGYSNIKCQKCELH